MTTRLVDLAAASFWSEPARWRGRLPLVLRGGRAPVTADQEHLTCPHINEKSEEMTATPQLIQILPEVSQFIACEHKLFIDGSGVAATSNETLAVYNPSTGEEIGRIPEAATQDLDRAVAAARAALEGEWGRMRPADRERCLHRFADLIERHGEELAQIETINQGKSINISRMIEVGASVEYVRYMAGWATKIEGSTLDLSIPVPANTRYTGLTLREPVGVVGAIVPWNFPLMIALWKIAPALACGCTMVLKPSEETPLTALRIAELAHEAGIPAGTFNVVTGRGSTVGAALTRHPGIDKITFTGSTATGKQVGAAALANMTKFSLELGGKNPLIVLSDVDTQSLLPGLMMGCFMNQGQVCAAASRLYLHESIFDRVVSDLEGALKSLRIGPGLDPSTDLQALVSSRHRDNVENIVGRSPAGGRPHRHGWEAAGTARLFLRADADRRCRRDEPRRPAGNLRSGRDRGAGQRPGAGAPACQ
jgi:phenylacetaldehyde dehydrogenase